MKSEELPSPIKETALKLSGQTGMYRGKVRDVYDVGDHYIAIVVTDRISAFDRILPRGIPYKGQVLNQLAAKFLRETEHIVPNWMLGSPDPNAIVGLKCDPFPVEMVVRGYLAGHAWREYRDGKRELSGVPLPEGLKKNDPLPEPIVTPTTKADQGHDEDIPKQAILEQGLVERDAYERMEEYALSLFRHGSDHALENGLILVDTKYEFGTYNGKIHLIDEVHTPDSSRYFYREGYTEKQRLGIEQKQLSKEFMREWLMEQGFQGEEGQEMPEIPDEVVRSVSELYIELFEKVAGEEFHPSKDGAVQQRIQDNIEGFLAVYSI